MKMSSNLNLTTQEPQVFTNAAVFILYWNDPGASQASLVSG